MATDAPDGDDSIYPHLGRMPFGGFMSVMTGALAFAGNNPDKGLLLLFNIPISLAGGALFGWLMWRHNEQEYEAAKEEEEMKNKVARLEKQVAELKRDLPQQPDTNIKE